MRILLLSEYSGYLKANTFVDANHLPREFQFKDPYHFNPTEAKIVTAVSKKICKQNEVHQVDRYL